jgi:hypothetical protein
MNIESRLRALEESTPGGYKTFDRNGNVVINSLLPALGWMQAAEALLASRGNEGDKAALREQLERSEGPDSGRGYLYQLVAALACGPVETSQGS